MNYYNEFDPKAAAWLRELIRAKLIPDGYVDERSIALVQPSDLLSYAQCHFFAGIAGWARSLELAGWPADRPVWTGSCPCQPFSSAGKQRGTADERHLWPEFLRLIAQRQPPAVFGEQVASALGRGWLAGVRADLEGVGYAVGAADLCAAGAGAPHIRQRLYWVAYSDLPQCDGWARGGEQPLHRQDARIARVGDTGHLCGRGWTEPTRPAQSSASDDGGMGESEGEGLQGSDVHGETPGRVQQLSAQPSRGLEHPNGSAQERLGLVGVPVESEQAAGRRGDANAWSRYSLVECADGAARRIEPESFPLAHGVSGRVGLLRGYGNAIVPPLAAEFISASEEARLCEFHGV